MDMAPPRLPTQTLVAGRYSSSAQPKVPMELSPAHAGPYLCGDEVTRWHKERCNLKPIKNGGFTMKNSVTYYEKLCFLLRKMVVLPWKMVVLPWTMVVLQWKTVVLLTIYIYMCVFKSYNDGVANRNCVLTLVVSHLHVGSMHNNWLLTN